jgi:hypothetical protein
VERPSPDSFRAMAGWFSRRSGSRVSIQNPVRRVLQALSLSRNPMPPRTTRKSDRRKVSDRTMVGLAQPVCLSASGTNGRRYESTMNLRKRKIHRGSFQYGGWTARPFSLCLAVAGEEFVLTSPFIERDYRNVGIWPIRVTGHIPISRRIIEGRPFRVGFDLSHQRLRKKHPYP